MIIKAISFDLDDTLWPLLPVIIKAEQKTNAWLKKNYPAASRLMQSDSMLKIRNRLIRENPKLVYQLSNLILLPLKKWHFQLSLQQQLH